MTQTSNTTVSRALTSFSIVVLFAAGYLPGNGYANQTKKSATQAPQTSQNEAAEAMELPGMFKASSPVTGDTTQKQSSANFRKRVSEQPTNIDLNKGMQGVKGNRVAQSTPSSRATRTEAKTILIPKQLVDGLVEKSDASDFHATAYCLKGRTATGELVRQGFIAADPKVLPLGTMVHIEAGKYTGIYKVADTGGRIRGKRIDIYVPNFREAKLFGRQRIKVKVLKRH